MYRKAIFVPSGDQAGEVAFGMLGIAAGGVAPSELAVNMRDVLNAILPLPFNLKEVAATVALVAEELFAALLSGSAELTLALFVITVPSAIGLFTWATITAATVCPTATDEKVTVRLFPDPPQTPVELQDTNVTCPGRLSVNVTLFAVRP